MILSIFEILATDNLLTQTPKDGGLGLGTNVVSALFLIVIVALVAYLTTSRVDLEEFRDA